MKAIRVPEFGPPEVMRVEEIDNPHPGPGEVLVRIRAAGVNPVDTYIRAGLYQPNLALPYTPGIDGAGEIVEVGPGVAHRRIGEAVYVSWSVTGTYAELAVCKEFNTHPLPRQISYSQGAAIGVPYGAAYRSLFQRARAVPGEIVLVHGGSGGVGLAALQLAHAAGLRIIATAGSEEGRRLVLEQGAHHALNHHQEGYLDEISQLTCGRGVDVILEMLANMNLAKDLSVLATGGRVVVIGSRGTVEIDPRDLMQRETAVLGMTLYNADERDQASMHAAFAAGLANGTLRPVVSRELPLEDAPLAHHAVIEASTFGKIVLVF